MTKNRFLATVGGILIALLGYEIFAVIIRTFFVIDFIAGTGFQSDDPIVFERIIANNYYLAILLFSCSVANLVAGLYSFSLSRNRGYLVCAVVSLVNVSTMILIHHDFPQPFVISLSLSVLISCFLGAFLGKVVSLRSKTSGG